MVTGIEELVDSPKARGATFQPVSAASFAGVEGKAVGDVMDFPDRPSRHSSKTRKAT